MTLSLLFDEGYYTDGIIGYIDYKDFPHFLKRAKFIKEVLKAKKVIVLGGAYGFLTKHLLDLGVDSVTIDNSDYAYKQKVIFDENYIKNDIISLPKYSIFKEADWIVSWNVLDCVSNDSESKQIGEVLNQFQGKQLHIICMSDKSYEKHGYFIRTKDYWYELHPKACLINYDLRVITHKPTGYEMVKNVPLCLELVSD